MASLSSVIHGLQVFAKYTGDRHDICAEHDIIYAGASVLDRLTDEDKKELEAWGWHFSKDADSWAIFV